MLNVECSSIFAFNITHSTFNIPPPAGGGNSAILPHLLVTEVFQVAKITAEYIWIDGQKPTAKLRSKTKVIDDVKSLKDIPDWGYDGSSTYQASGHFSDLQLKPAKYFPDPLHDEGAILVMCEVLNPDNSVHWSNTRARLR